MSTQAISINHGDTESTEMDMELAERINAACTAHFFYRERIGPKPLPHQSLKGYSLPQLLQARNMMRRKNREADPNGAMLPVALTCDDRYLAALFVACHYDEERTAEGNYGAVALAEGKAVVVCRVVGEDPEVAA